MLPWWGWVMVWLLLLVGGAAWVGVLSRRVWGKTKVLAAEVQRAGALGRRARGPRQTSVA